MLVVNAFVYDTRVQKEAKSLAEAGYDVIVFALHRAGLAQSESCDGYRIERIRLRSRGWGTFLAIRLLKYLEFFLRAIYRMLRQRPAIIHAHDLDALIPVCVAAFLTRARMIYDSHELWIEQYNLLLRAAQARRLLGVIEGILARRVDAVITVSPSIASLLAQRYRIPTPTVLMHSQEYRPVQRNDVLRQEFNIPPGQRIIIYAGVFAPGRGLENLVEAAVHLDHSVVVLMGPDQMNGQIEQLITARGLQERVFIREPVPPSEVSHYVASADLGVISTQNVDLSFYYGSGNKLFHYFMAGIPAAVSNHPEKRRVVETYDVGVVFDETDPTDIARAINELFNDQQTYQAMCQRARQVSRDTLNWQVESQKLLALYEQLVQTDK
jgi:glycosyltransferase involved in cell wall biosynthesis